MKKNEEGKGPLAEGTEDAMLALALAQNAAEQQARKPEENVLMQELLKRLLRKLDAEEAANRENYEKQQRFRLQQVETYKEAEQQLRNRQAFCDHKKENGKPATGGQRFSDGRFGFICQRCFKLWFVPPEEGATRIPEHLIPAGDLIGSAF